MEKFEKRILAGNPYKLNRFGVLEVPGSAGDAGRRV